MPLLVLILLVPIVPEVIAMFNPLSILSSLSDIYAIEYAAGGVIAFGVSLLVYSLIHAGKTHFD